MELTARAPEKFDMILSPDNPHYMSLPGISVLVGGMWIMNLSYWGFNQYIIQRALAAAIGSAVLSFALKMLWPELPFIDRVGLVFLLCLSLGILVTLMEKSGVQDNAVDLEDIDFSTSRNFNLSALGVVLILTALYATWW